MIWSKVFLRNGSTLVFVHPDPTTPKDQQGPRRPWFPADQSNNDLMMTDLLEQLDNQYRPVASAKLPDGWQSVPEPHCVTEERRNAKDMPLGEVLSRMAKVLAMTIMVLLAVSVKADVSPLRGLSILRIGPRDVQVTVDIEPSADNLTACVAVLRHPGEGAGWTCGFITEPTSTSVVIPITSLLQGDYAVDAALWRAHRNTHTDRKVSTTYRRSFGVQRF